MRVGVTGGIGSGKSLVCRMLSVMGVPVFYADVAARAVMEHQHDVVSAITALFGSQAYINGRLNREYIASVVYNDRSLLDQLNAITHPATVRFGEQWMAGINSSYAIKEAAIFFESGTDKSVDVMVGVYASKELRLARAMGRGNISEEKVLAIMAQQMDEDEKMKRCDFVLYNDDRLPLLPQVLRLHEELIKRAATDG